MPLCRGLVVCAFKVSHQILASVLGPRVHNALRYTWISGACTCSKQCSVVRYSLWSQLLEVHLEGRIAWNCIWEIGAVDITWKDRSFQFAHAISAHS